MATPEQIYEAFAFDTAPDSQLIGFTVASMQNVGGAAIRQEAIALGYDDPGRIIPTDHGLLLEYQLHAMDTDQSISTTYNEMLLNQIEKLPDGISIVNAQEQLQPFFDRVHDYNQSTLIPYTTATAKQQAVSTFYENNISPATGKTLAQSVEWSWTRGSGSELDDECADAQDQSPASYDELTNTAGGEPPVHQNCECTLDPGDLSEDDLPDQEHLWTGA